MMRIHTLKTWPIPFGAIWVAVKTFEVRSELDRKFNEVDLVILRETKSTIVTNEYTGRVVVADIGYLLRGAWGLPHDVVAFSLLNMQRFANVIDVKMHDHKATIELEDGGALNVAAGELRK